MSKKCKVRITYTIAGKTLAHRLCGAGVAKGKARCPKHEELAQREPKDD